MKNKLLPVGIIVIVIIGAIIANVIDDFYSKRPTFAAVQAKKMDISETLDFDGTVTSQTVADLGFENGGKIIVLTHQVGDLVTAGTILAKSDNSDLIAQYNGALAQVSSAQARLEQDKKIYKVEKLKYQSLRDGHAKTIQHAQAEASKAAIDAQQAQIAAANADVQFAKDQIDKTIIRAPFDGVVSKQDAQVGEVAAADNPIIFLISNGSYKIEALVSQTDVNKMKIGDKATVTLDPFGTDNRLGATVTLIDPAETQINGISNYKVTLEFSDSSIPDIRSGQDANISILSGSKSGAIVIPKQSIFEEAGKKYVYVSSNGNDQKTEIETGIYSSDGMVEVTKGLDEGQGVLRTNK